MTITERRRDATDNTAVEYLSSIGKTKSLKNRIKTILPIVALLTVIGVFWWLKLIALTMAGEAFCGHAEHTHGEECYESMLLCTSAEEGHTHTDECYESVLACDCEEHTHTSDCYSDTEADRESADDWEETLSSVPDDISRVRRLTMIARTQLGYKESRLNFTVGSDGVRRGYTRYGEWYGNPYGDWSGMFVSFCLKYAGVSGVPYGSGAETMRIEWQNAELYRDAADYEPFEGDIVFFDKNRDGASDAVAILLTEEDGSLRVIEGDVEGEVREVIYSPDDGVVLGYGMTEKGQSPILVEDGKLDVYLDGASERADSTVIAKKTNFATNLLTSNNSFVLYVESGGRYYAIDGNGNAVEVYVDASGNVSSDADDTNSLLWTFTSSGGGSNYLIQNVSTGKYLHAFATNETGVVTTGAYTSVTESQSGGRVRIRSNSQYAKLDTELGRFAVTSTQSEAVIYSFAMTSKVTVWLDGTCGGLRSLGGSLDRGYTIYAGERMRLPSSWQSPSKYAQTVRGWYDVIHAEYYTPGEEVVITENTVFYADWVAASYDIGQFNTQTVNTVSSNEHITVKIFDYNYLFNIHSLRPTVTVSASSHSETWSLVQSGTVPFRADTTLNYIFKDQDEGNKDISNPANVNNANNYVAGAGVTAGLYNSIVGEIVFGTDNDYDPSTGTGYIGKTYLGSGDYLFQFVDDPNNDYYGYYYYDAALNAASFNQSEGRFYVYEYLARTSDSAGQSDSGKYSDFLPLNSPYVNTNGNNVTTFTYNGQTGEYQGVNHYTYDVGYNTDNTVQANLAFGMSMELKFHLADVPGTRKENGEWGNQDLYGHDMHFEFAGDDDLWVLLDGEVILDMGGIHQSEAGDINFSSGIVTVNGKQTNTLYDIASGDHVLTVLYLERGSSMSNCSMHFNVAPRFALDIQKEDVLSQELLDGAEFSVYMDEDCTLPAVLWNSKEEYNAGMPSTNVFAVSGGHADMWGFSPGKTYYIKETKPPGADGYGRASGIICLYIDKRGIDSSTVEIVPEWSVLEGAPIDVSPGFTVHGFDIVEDTHSAYIKVTNAQDWVVETTTVQAIKRWNDKLDHSSDAVTVYLTVTDPDGTVRRIREIKLSAENGWKYTWTSLPKYGPDMVTPIVYRVEEAYMQGYQSSVEKKDEITITTYEWAESMLFENGKQYLLKTSRGYLSAQSTSNNTFSYVDEQTAKSSILATWTATVSSGKVKLSNGAGQTITFNNSWNNRYYYLTNSSGNQSLTYTDTGGGLRLAYKSGNTSYYLGEIGSNGRIQSTTSTNSALVLTPMTLITKTTVEKVENFAFEITNTPLERETSVKVTKTWDTGMMSSDIYERELVTVKLYADGKDTGRTVTLSLKNGWSDTFLGLPYENEDGSVIVYTVLESWDNKDWRAEYSEVRHIGGTPGTYEVTVTNVYRWGRGYELPSTGGSGDILWVLSGAVIMLASLVSGSVLWYKRKGGEE